MVLMSTGQARKMCLGLAVIGMLESTPRANLTCILGVYSNEPSTSFFRFVQSSWGGANSQEVVLSSANHALEEGNPYPGEGKERETLTFVWATIPSIAARSGCMQTQSGRGQCLAYFRAGGQKAVAGCLTQTSTYCLPRCNPPNALCIKQVYYWSFRVRCRC